MRDKTPCGFECAVMALTEKLELKEYAVEPEYWVKYRSGNCK
jgi:hypothetical protein